MGRLFCRARTAISTGHRVIGLRSELVRQFVQPAVYAVRFDVREGLAIHARSPAILAALPVRECQHIAAVHLVV